MTPFRTTTFLLLAVFLSWGGFASAKYAAVDIEEVPVDRLIRNLSDVVGKDPKNGQAVFNLARAHAMAYSLRSETVQVVKKTDLLWFGYEPPAVPFRDVVRTDDPEKLRAAKAHLDQAISLYKEAMKLLPDDLRVELGHAWLLSRTDKKADAVAALRKVAERAWDREKTQESAGLGRHSIVSEAALYLLPLLDDEKDKAEIATLRERSERMDRLPRMITPIVVPLRSGSTVFDLEDRSASVAFDVDGSGLPQRWTWTSRDAAWLVHDPSHSGSIRSGLQLFGSVTFWMFWKTGYDALEALDDNHDGQLTGLELDGLALWHDANGNGISEPGEVRPLSAYGVVALSCRSQVLEAHPDRIAFSSLGARFRDGTTRPTFDLVLHSR